MSTEENLGFTAESITSIIESSGPIVECVVLRADGAIDQMNVDMTPKMKKVQGIIGGDVTFIGQFHKEEEVEGVILVAKRNAEADGLPLSKQVIQPPFHEEKIFGDVLLMRTSEDGTPVDFTKAEYEKFAARTDVENIEIPEDEDEEVDPEDYDSHEDDEEVEGESDLEEEEEEADEGNLLDMLMPIILQKFEAENGRAPEAHELEAIKAAMLVKFGGEAPGEVMETIQEDEEEEEEEAAKENVVIKADVQSAYKKRSSGSKRVSLENSTTTTTTTTTTSSKKARIH